MFSRARAILISVVVLLSLRLTAFDDHAKAPASDADLASADQVFRGGKFAEAETSYRAILQKDAKLIPAQVGLVRSMLKQQKNRWITRRREQSVACGLLAYSSRVWRWLRLISARKAVACAEVASEMTELRPGAMVRVSRWTIPQSTSALLPQAIAIESEFVVVVPRPSRVLRYPPAVVKVLL